MSLNVTSYTGNTNVTIIGIDNDFYEFDKIVNNRHSGFVNKTVKLARTCAARHGGNPNEC